MRKALFFLGILNDSDLDWMISHGTKREVAAGSVLVHEGKPVDSMFIVLDGRLAVSSSKAGGKEIARLMCGEVVGEMSFLDSRPPSASVSATEKCFVLAIPTQRLSEKLENDTGFAARFYHALGVFLSDRLRSTVSMLGYGRMTPDDQDAIDELDPAALDKVSLAGARFDWLQRRLRSI